MKSIFAFIVLAGINTVAVTANEPVQFIDAKLKEVIEHKLRVTDPTPADMLGLTELKTTSITDLTGLEYAKNLTKLRIDNTFFHRRSYTGSRRIVDISALSSLSGLISLELIRNHIVDLTPLESLIHLKELNLKENRIEDISALSSLYNLETLNLDHNYLIDVSALQALSKIKFLGLQYNRIHDVRVLSSLTELEFLYLRNNNISDISALSGLKKLRRLNLYKNQIYDITPLSSLENLSGVSLSFNNISDASVLSSLPNLKNVDITNNPYYLKRFLHIIGGIIGAIVIGGIIRRLYLNKYKPDKKRLCLRTKFSIICGFLAPFLLWFCCALMRNLLPYKAFYSLHSLTKNNLFLYGPMAFVLIIGFVCAISVLKQGKDNPKYMNSRPATVTTLFFLVIVTVLCCSFSLLHFVGSHIH